MEVITQAEAARRFRVAPQLITKLIKPGKRLADAVVTRDGKPMIDWGLAERHWVERADPAQPSQARGGNAASGTLEVLTEHDRAYKEARARKMAAEADAAEAARAVRLGTLIDAAEATRTWTTLSRELRDALMALPTALADELVALTDPRALALRLDTALRKVIAERIAAAIDDLQDASVDDAAG
jgi:phage terminase Nu1 subunit (DNA packaging protein)